MKLHAYVGTKNDTHRYKNDALLWGLKIVPVFSGAAC